VRARRAQRVDGGRGALGAGVRCGLVRRGRRAAAAGGRQARRRPRAAGAAGRQDLATTLLAGSAAPRIRARHYRAKIGGAADPATSPINVPVVATSTLSPRHHA